MRSSARTTIKGPLSVLDLKRPPTSPGEMLREEFLRPGAAPHWGRTRTPARDYLPGHELVVFQTLPTSRTSCRA